MVLNWSYHWEVPSIRSRLAHRIWSCPISGIWAALQYHSKWTSQSLAQVSWWQPLNMSGWRLFRKASGIKGVDMIGFRFSWSVEGGLGLEGSESSDELDKQGSRSGDRKVRNAEGLGDVRLIACGLIRSGQSSDRQTSSGLKPPFATM